MLARGGSARGFILSHFILVEGGGRRFINTFLPLGLQLLFLTQKRSFVMRDLDRVLK